MRKLTVFCKHFTGTQHATCKAGVAYDAVTLGKGTAQRSIPCIGDKHNPLGASCELCVFPTPEEIAAEEEADAKRMQDTMTARSAIVESLGGSWKKGTPSQRGKIDCPVCKKPRALNFSRSGYNGHIHAQCSTDGCVAWME